MQDHQSTQAESFQFVHLTREILELAADRIANHEVEFMCCAVQLSARFFGYDEFEVRAEFGSFLKYQGVLLAGYLERGLTGAVGKDGIRDIRVLFLLNTAELVDQQYKAPAQPKAQTRHIFNENSSVTEDQMREYLAALRLYIRRPAEFFAKAGNELKGVCGICAAIKSYMNSNLVSYDIWFDMLNNTAEDKDTPKEISSICRAFEDTRNKSGGRTPQRLKMAKELYTALRKYYPV